MSSTNLQLGQEHHTPTTFLSFRKLPTELRLEIWKIAANVPRTLEVLITESWHLDDTPSLNLSSHTVVPSILYTNSESREMALKFYFRDIDGRVVKLPHLHDARPNLTVPWINWSKDRIFLRISDHSIMEHPRLDEFAKMCQANGLRRLVFDSFSLHRRGRTPPSYAKWWFLDELGFLAKNEERLAVCQYWCRGFDLAPLGEGAPSFFHGHHFRSTWFAKKLEDAWDKAKRDDPTIGQKFPLIQSMTVSRRYSPHCTNEEHNKMAEEWIRSRS